LIFEESDPLGRPARIGWNCGNRGKSRRKSRHVCARFSKKQVNPDFPGHSTKSIHTMSHYHKLYTPEDSAVVFIDHQPQMTFGVANIDRATLINNVTLLAKVAKEFNIPAVLTAVETESFSGYIWPQLLDVFPGQAVIERTSMNSWDDEGFRNAVKATGRKNIIMTGLWTEVCVTWPTIEMLGEGYNIYVVEDCCGATSVAAHEASLSRMVQAGAVRVTTIPALLEWQRDWAKKDHYNNLMGIIKGQGGAYGVGVEYAYTMVHKAPQSAVKPQIVPKSAGH
jgi:nicotinamidase-related amidase